MNIAITAAQQTAWQAAREAELAADDWWHAELACLLCPDGDHDWNFVDDSFDHEYSTEQIFYYECCRCGTVTPYEDDDSE